MGSARQGVSVFTLFITYPDKMLPNTENSNEMIDDNKNNKELDDDKDFIQVMVGRESLTRK